MKDLGYYNGRWGLIDDMTVPMNDRASCFGDGVYDAAYAVGGVPFELTEHVARLYRSAALVEIVPPMEQARMEALLRALVRHVDSPDTMIYWQLSRGTAPRSHVFPEGPANLWITVRPAPMQDVYRRYQLITQEDTRFFHCNIKTLNLLPNVMASQRAKEAGCHEAVFHRAGRVTECAHSNVHILKDGVLRTAPLDELILPGITRGHLIALAGQLGIPVQEKPFTVEEMMAADEVLFTSAGALGCGVDAIDGQAVGGRAPRLLRALQDAYQQKLRRETRPERT